MKITYINHSCFVIETQGLKIVTDPFILKGQEELINNADIILLSHLHSDHCASINYAYCDNSKIVAIYETCNYFNSKGYKNVIGANLGGKIDISNIEISIVKAEHSSSVEENGKIIYGGVACGFIIKSQNQTLYFMGDTDIFGDMKLICDFYKPTIIFMPIGNTYTLSLEKAKYAKEYLLNDAKIIPMHYNLTEISKEQLNEIKNIQIIEKLEGITL